MYNHKEIEVELIKKWEQESLYKVEDKNKQKIYVLVMFPYPSGEGLHAGHARVYVSTDIYSRLKRMQGFDVLQPIGWDAFGLPAETYAINNNTHPSISTFKNINNFKEQCKLLGISYDWSREINTADPEYYKWTQWIFLQFFKDGMVYESFEPVNWCPKCKTGLANEDLEHGCCERCGSPIERKSLRQWVLKITDYAERLLNDLDELTNWPEYIKELQRNWIGISYGDELKFKVEGHPLDIKSFTTRIDTLFGATFIALSPESKYVDDFIKISNNKEEIEEYRRNSFAKRLNIREEANKEKTGVRVENIYVINPANNEKLPVYIADYVIGGHGTGAIFGVPAHDERDYNFAKKFNLEIKRVIKGDSKLPFIEYGTLINSGKFNDLSFEEAKKAIAKEVSAKNTKQFKLKDWVFSRQRYWGEPIPLIHCKKCGVIPVDEKELPLKLPEIVNYKPTGTGESPLASIEEWVNIKCNKCGGEAKRETNTMPQWAGSCWYYLRFIDNKNDNEFVNKEKEKKWMNVDLYAGGVEHATRHLIYARYWHKFLYDKKLVSTNEPFNRLYGVGILKGPDGTKMSKRLGNVINPIDISSKIGTDALRMYIAFIAPFSQSVSWNNNDIAGPRRFLERVWKAKDEIQDKEISEKLSTTLTKKIDEIEKDIENYRFNTAVSHLMILFSKIKEDGFPKKGYITFLKLLSPISPFITDKIWREFGNKNSIHLEKYPNKNDFKSYNDDVEIIIQLKGKKKGSISVPNNSEESIVMKKIKDDEKLVKLLNNSKFKIFIKNKIISFI